MTDPTPPTGEPGRIVPWPSVRALAVPGGIAHVPGPAPRTPRAVTLHAPFGRGLLVEFAARLDTGRVLDGPPDPGSWFVTHALGTPAGGTYTEVAFPEEAGCEDGLPEHVADAVVRHLATEMYARTWAFHYRPDQYADSIAAHGLIRRERVIVEGIEVL